MNMIVDTISKFRYDCKSLFIVKYTYLPCIWLVCDVLKFTNLLFIFLAQSAFISSKLFLIVDLFLENNW